MVKSELLDSLNQVFDDDSMTISSIDYIDMVEIESEMLVSKQLRDINEQNICSRNTLRNSW